MAWEWRKMIEFLPQYVEITPFEASATASDGGRRRTGNAHNLRCLTAPSAVDRSSIGIHGSGVGAELIGDLAKIVPCAIFSEHAPNRAFSVNCLMYVRLPSFDNWCNALLV